MIDDIDRIQAFFRSEKRMPSYQELTKVLGLSSKSAVSYRLDKLIEAGALLKDRRGRLSFSANVNGVKLLGSIKAGFPSPSEEELSDTMSLDEYLIEKPNSTFMLKVDGDSMQDFGIIRSDLVIVERGRSPNLGDIVVAKLDGEYTLKLYSKDKSGKIYLKAGNIKYPDFYPNEELAIEAVVVSLVRKYK